MKAYPPIGEYPRGAFPQQVSIAYKAQDVIKVLQDWYEAIRDGHANERQPNLDTGKIYNKYQVDLIIGAIDEGFMGELYANDQFWFSKGITKTPNFSSLEGSARLAFCQDLWEATKDISVEL